MLETIYVQIPSYKDGQLGATVGDLLRQAVHPGRLRIAVAWQHGPQERIPAELKGSSNLQVLRLRAADSRGPNWARRLLQEKYGGEDFTLFLDSHHRFVRGWDRMLVEMFRELTQQGIPKPLLTAYLPPYQPQRDPLGRAHDLMKIYPLRRTDGLLTHLTGRRVPLWKWLKRPIPAEFVSLHLLFAAGSFNREILFDPEIYFFGDEVLTGLRAYTFGYDLYHPHRIVGWHLYDRATRTPHWDDHRWWRTHELESFRRMRRLIHGQRVPRGYFSDLRSVSQYERWIGIPLIEGGAG